MVVNSSIPQRRPETKHCQSPLAKLRLSSDGPPRVILEIRYLVIPTWRNSQCLFLHPWSHCLLSILWLRCLLYCPMGGIIWTLIIAHTDNITDSMDTNSTKLQWRVEDRKACCAAVHGVTKNQTQLSDWVTTASAHTPYLQKSLLPFRTENLHLLRVTSIWTTSCLFLMFQSPVLFHIHA